MSNTWKTVIISCASSLVTSAIVGTITYVKGKKNGINEGMQQLGGHAQTGTEANAQHAQH